MEPISTLIGVGLAALSSSVNGDNALSGIFGNRADGLFMVALKSVAKNIKKENKLWNHHLGRSILKSYYSALITIVNECIKEGNQTYTNKTEIKWLKERKHYFESQLKKVDKMENPNIPISDISMLEQLLTKKSNLTEEEFERIQSELISFELSQDFSIDLDYTERYKNKIREKLNEYFCGFFAHDLKYDQAVQHIFTSEIMSDIHLTMKEMDDLLSELMNKVPDLDEVLKEMTSKLDTIEETVKEILKNQIQQPKEPEEETKDLEDLKIAYLYSSITQNGPSFLRSKELVKELKSLYKVRLAYGILKKENLEAIADYEIKKQFISEEALLENFDILILENFLDKRISNKNITSSIIKEFISNGGICIFLCQDDMDKGIDTYNKLLEECALPQFRKPTSENEFPSYPMIKNFDRHRIVGWDEDNFIQYPRTYKIEITPKYLHSLPGEITGVFKSVNQLVVNFTRQVDIFNSEILLSGNSTTRMLTTGDYWWDGDPYHYFGAYKHVNNGFGILIGSNICSDEMVVKHHSDAIQLLLNTITHFRKMIKESDYDMMFEEF